MSPVDRWGLVVAIVICAVIAGAYALLFLCARHRGPAWAEGEVSGATTTQRLRLARRSCLARLPIADHRPGLWLTLLPRSHGVGRHDHMGSLIPSHGFNESAEISLRSS